MQRPLTRVEHAVKGETLTAQIERCAMSGILNPVNFLKSALWRVSFAIRESGQALERLGCTMQGIYSHDEISELCD